MRFAWTPYAMVRIALFFTTGILLGIYQPYLFSEGDSIFISLASTALYFAGYFFWNGKALASTSGTIGLVSILFLGYTHVLSRTDIHQIDSFVNVSQSINSYVATVRSIPEEKASSWRVEADIVSFLTDEWQPVCGKVLLYFGKEMSEPTWKYGDQLLIKGSPQLLNPPTNPGEFDFKRFLSFKNIYHQHFLRKNQFAFVAPASTRGFIYYSHEARRWASTTINHYIEGKQQQVIAAALILGVTDGVDNDLQNAYAASGTLHILAVSGLHVGIIYALLLFLLKPLQKFHWGRWLIAGVSLLSLWAFAFVTGLSPSVLRAVTMFSFVAIAKPFGARTNIYNTLAASAFILLIYNPYFIMSVGFQLSYLAVVGIVYLQQPLQRLWETENRTLDWMWQLSCVSVAAQLTTLSLGLLYFHQFPVYFLISNLFAIPLSTLILVMGIALLAFSSVHFLAGLIGKLMWAMIWVLNQIVLTIEGLPFSIITDIYITNIQCWVLTGFLAGMVLLFQFRNIRWAYFSFACSILLTFFQWWHFYEEVNIHQFVVYQVNRHIAFEWVDNGQSFIVADSALLHDKQRMGFHIRPNRLLHQVSNVHTDIPFQRKLPQATLYCWRGKIFIHQRNHQTGVENIPADFQIISENALPASAANITIVDGSNSNAFFQKLSSTFDQSSLYSTSKTGAFTLND